MSVVVTMAATEAPQCSVSVNDRCHDREDSSGILVVQEVSEKRADEYELTGGITVADVYSEYPPSDRVVRCAYKQAIENWAEPDVFTFPESKLECYDAGNYTEHEESVECEHCGAEVETTAAWVEHVVIECQLD